MTHEPLTINKFKTGLVQSQPNQVLVDDAFPVLQNAFVFRNTVQRRYSWRTIGRLRRVFTGLVIANSSPSPWSLLPSVYALLTPPITVEANSQMQPGSLVITIHAGPDVTYTDNGNGVLVSATPGASGNVIYTTGAAALTSTIQAIGGFPVTVAFNYFPNLPAMGIFDRNTATNTIENVFFDTKYAYDKIVNGGFEEFLPGTTWTLSDWNLPSYANYWQDDLNRPIFWMTSNQGSGGQPIRYTNGVTAWYDFTPAIGGPLTAANVAPDPNSNTLWQCKFLVPFRGRLFAFNTYEGIYSGGIGGSIQKRARVRCCGVGNPFTKNSAIVTTTVSNTWLDTTEGLGYFEDLPTTEEIIGVWSTMNQIIIKTNTKTWVLSYVGINFTPFKIDLLDESLGSASGFGSVNMGGYIAGVGDRSMTNSSPTSVVSIDEKILDLVLNMNRDEHGLARVYGLRDYNLRCNSFIYPFQGDRTTLVKFPNRRLIQNYDNGSWAIYEDSLTCLGYFRDVQGITWQTATFTWGSADKLTWETGTSNQPVNAAGNQQGYVGVLDDATEAGPSLYISNIVGAGTSAAVFTSPDCNLETGQIIKLSGITGTQSSLNGTVGMVQIITNDTFYLFSYSESQGRFATPVLASGSYIGGGEISLRPNFNIVTKAFNMLEQGKSMHISYVDALVNVDQGVTVELNVYASLNNSNAVNLLPENTTSDSIFGDIVSLSNPTTYALDQVNNRSLINQRANMLTLEFTLDDATMASDNFSTEFLLSSLTVWKRDAGRPLMPLGGG